MGVSIGIAQWGRCRCLLWLYALLYRVEDPEDTEDTEEE